MAYSELIKSFEKIRDYMREFYVYGFKSREEYDRKSCRSYDNEKRRIESWLGTYMGFRQDPGGKTVFLTADARELPHNPLYTAFKTKSFTDNDITLHFYLLDLLRGDRAMTIREITDAVEADYLAQFEAGEPLDESTIRKKLKEYEALGLLQSEKRGRELLFRRADPGPELSAWRDAIDFFSEVDPMGVVGSYLLDRFGEREAPFGYKHRYFLHALDSEVLYALLLAIRERRRVEISRFAASKGELREHSVFPIKIYQSTQTGRQYLLARQNSRKRPVFFRLDTIRRVRAGEIEERAEEYARCAEKLTENLWGVSLGTEHSPDHIEMTIRVGPHEDFLIARLQREKRCGRVEPVDGETWRFTADVSDAAEMLPWLRSFLGRIVSLSCSNSFVEQRFREDLKAMYGLYGGGDDAVQ